MELKGSLKEPNAVKTAVGQLIARLRHGMEEQPLRGFMVGLAVSVDRLFLVWGQRDGSQMLFYHLPQQAFALREDSPGLQLFLKVVTAPAETAGFPRLPPGLIDIPYSRLKPVDDGPYTAIKFQSKDPAHALSVRNTRVFLAHMVDEHGEELSTILKTGTNACIQTEVKNLDLLHDNCSIVNKLDSGVVGDAALGNDYSFVLVHPVGSRLLGTRTVSKLVHVFCQLADVIEDLYSNYGMLHRDLSLNNIGLGPDGNVLLWDLATAVELPSRAEQPWVLTGTAITMAISVQLGKAATKSSELEAILYMLIQLCSLEEIHWRKGWPELCDLKWTAMTNPDVYKKKVLDRLNPALRPLVTHVHDLFFKPVDTDWGLMYIYQDNVPWEELKKALRRGAEEVQRYRCASPVDEDATDMEDD